MKKLLMILLLASTSAFAGEYTINGIQFNEATILTQYRYYQGSPNDSTCGVTVFLKKSKSFFKMTTITKDNRKATCADLRPADIANFLTSGTSKTAQLSSLLMALRNSQLTEDKQDMSDHAPSNELACKIYINNKNQTTPLTPALGDLCYGVSSSEQGSFSTKN